MPLFPLIVTVRQTHFRLRPTLVFLSGFVDVPEPPRQIAVGRRPPAVRLVVACIFADNAELSRDGEWPVRPAAPNRFVGKSSITSVTSAPTCPTEICLTASHHSRRHPAGSRHGTVRCRLPSTSPRMNARRDFRLRRTSPVLSWPVHSAILSDSVRAAMGDSLRNRPVHDRTILPQVLPGCGDRFPPTATRRSCCRDAGQVQIERNNEQSI